MSEVVYDPSLTSFLINNGFGNDLSCLLPISGSWSYGCTKSEWPGVIDEIKRCQQGGCIFTLPGTSCYVNDSSRTDWVVVFYTPISSDDIRRRVALKAFL